VTHFELVLAGSEVVRHDSSETYAEGDELFHNGRAWRIEAVEEGGVLRCVPSRRAYRTTRLPTLKKEVHGETGRGDDVLKILYAEVCSTWRALVDVRFKLLAFLPAVSGVAIWKLFEHSDGPNALALAALGGLFVTFAIFVYDRRNSVLHDDLISRGRRIEFELGISTGVFLGRRGERRPYLRHDAALYMIYSVVAAAWIAAALVILVR
jgi:hypothetical protein